MQALTRFTAVITLMTLLAGCGATKMAVRPEATRQVQTVALIKISEPDAYVANDFGNPGMMFGAIGGAVAGSSSANAGKNLDQIVKEARYDAGDHFTNLLRKRLAAAGYRVNLIEVPREKKVKLLEDYSSVDTGGADAVLDLAIESIGYATEHPMFSRHWRPASQILVALVDSRSGEKLYSDKFMYGYHNPLMSGTDIEAPTTYHFKDKDALFADSDKLVSDIRHSVEAVTQEIEKNLQK